MSDVEKPDRLLTCSRPVADGVTARLKRQFWRLLKAKGLGWRAVRVLLATCCALVVLVLIFENHFIYFPSKYPEGIWEEVANAHPREGEVFPAIEDVWLVAADAVKLHGWFCSPQMKSAKASLPVETKEVLLFLHGNAGNITDRFDFIRMLIKLPIRVFILDYRGFGKSEGSPSEDGIYLDAMAAWDYLLAERRIEPDQIILFGESLGGAVAIDLARRTKPGGLIVQSAFTSIGDMAAVVMPAFPRLLLHTKMDSIRKVLDIRCPKLFVHSRADEVVPFELGQRLFKAAAEPKQFYEVKRALHNETHLVGGKAYIDAIGQFIRSCARQN